MIAYPDHLNTVAALFFSDKTAHLRRTYIQGRYVFRLRHLPSILLLVFLSCPATCLLRRGVLIGVYFDDHSSRKA